MDVSRQVKVELIHGNNLRISTASCPALIQNMSGLGMFSFKLQCHIFKGDLGSKLI